MLKLQLFLRSFANTAKNEKIIKKINKYQNKIEKLVIKNKLPLYSYTCSISYHDNICNQKEYIEYTEYIEDEKEYILNINKYLNS